MLELGSWVKTKKNGSSWTNAEVHNILLKTKWFIDDRIKAQATYVKPRPGCHKFVSFLQQEGMFDDVTTFMGQEIVGSEALSLMCDVEAYRGWALSRYV